MTKPNPVPWHKFLAFIFEQLLARFNVTVQAEVKLMSDPPRLDILLIRRMTSTWTHEQLARLPDGIRNSTATHILIEFKYTESLDEEAISKTHGYDTFYRIYQELKRNEVQTFILSSKTPSPKLLSRYGYHLTEWPGVYQSNNVMLQNILILVLNDLRNEPHNAFVKCFASRQKPVRESLEMIEQLGIGFLPSNLWSFLVWLQQYLLKKGETIMSKGITVDDGLIVGKNYIRSYMNNLPADEALELVKKYMASMSVDEVLSQYRPEEVLSQYRPEERLKGLKPEEVLSRYKPEEVLSRYKPEEVLSRYKPYLAENQQQAECRALVRRLCRTLQVRFNLPADNLQAIQEQLQKFNGEILESLNDVALTSTTFAEFEAQLAKANNTL